MDDLISRQAAIDEINKYGSIWMEYTDGMTKDKIAEEALKNAKASMKRIIRELPSAQPEPLTDKEQRIFLAAMEREEKICEEMDRNYVREPYEDSLMSICREIKRKVKGALWT